MLTKSACKMSLSLWTLTSPYIFSMWDLGFSPYQALYHFYLRLGFLPIDLLTHRILGLVCEYKWWVAQSIDFDTILGFYKRAYLILTKSASKVTGTSLYKFLSDLLSFLCGTWVYTIYIPQTDIMKWTYVT
jgi:hypothetical protein